MTTRSREHRALRAAVLAFAVAGLAGASVVATTWTGHTGARVHGLFYCLLFGGLGIGLVVWANGLMPRGDHVQAREPLAATPAESSAVDEELSDDAVARRTLLRRSLWVAGGALAAGVAVPLGSLGPSPGKVLLRTAWTDGVALATADGTRVNVAGVPTGSLLTVFPVSDLRSADGQVVLVRVDPAMLHLSSERATWAPQGLLAYSKVCTHAGCPVGLYQADSHRLLCPCHQSAFDVLHEARPISGPAAWPLPQLPLRVEAGGAIVAAGPLSAPVGPGWWRA